MKNVCNYLDAEKLISATILPVANVVDVVDHVAVPGIGPRLAICSAEGPCRFCLSLCNLDPDALGLAEVTTV